MSICQYHSLTLNNWLVIHDHLLCLRPRRGGGIINCPRLTVRLSVRPSVHGVPRHNSRTKMPRKPKIGRMEAHHTGIQRTYLEAKRSKVKVTRPINAHTVNVQYLPNGKAYELQTWYTDAAWRPASATSAVSFKVNGQGRKVMWCVRQV